MRKPIALAATLATLALLVGASSAAAAVPAPGLDDRIVRGSDELLRA